MKGLPRNARNVSPIRSMPSDIIDRLEKYLPIALKDVPTIQMPIFHERKAANWCRELFVMIENSMHEPYESIRPHADLTSHLAIYKDESETQLDKKVSAREYNDLYAELIRSVEAIRVMQAQSWAATRSTEQNNHVSTQLERRLEQAAKDIKSRQARKHAEAVELKNIIMLWKSPGLAVVTKLRVMQYETQIASDLDENMTESEKKRYEHSIQAANEACAFLDEVATCGSSDAFLSHLQKQSMGDEGTKIWQGGWRELLEMRRAHQALYREHKIEAAKPLCTVYEGLDPPIGVIKVDLTATRKADGSGGALSTPGRNVIDQVLDHQKISSHGRSSGPGASKVSKSVNFVRTAEELAVKQQKPARDALPTRSAMRPITK